MRKHLVAGLLLGTASLMGGSAFAADAIEIVDAAPITLPADNPFNGFYAGVHAGYSKATSEEEFYAWANAYNSDFYGLDYVGAFSNDLTGASLGAQAGVNVVLDSGLMIGGEVSVSWAALQGSTDEFDGEFDWYCDCGVYGGEFDAQIDGLGTGVVKLGWATDQFMVYATAGLALASVSWTDVIGGDSDDGNWFLQASGDTMRQGWTVGAGGSMMVTESTSIDLQYAYSDFGTLDVDAFGELSTEDSEPSNIYAGGFEKSVALSAHTIKIGINQHF